MSNTDLTKKTIQKTKKMSKTDLTKKTIQKTKKMKRTIQRNRQHWLYKTKGKSKTDNPEKQATLAIQDGLFLISPSSCIAYVACFSGLSIFDFPFVLLRRNRQHRLYKTKGKSKTDNPEKQAT
jgi:hypothetical protein